MLTTYSQLLLALYRDARALAVHDFQDHALEALKPHLPFDSCIWGSARMAPEGLDVHSLHLHNTPPGIIEAHERVKHLNPTPARLVRQPATTMAFDVEADYPGPELAPYREYLREFGHAHMLITSSADSETRLLHWVNLCRANANSPFTIEDRHLLSCLAPHLMQALAINRQVHLERLNGNVARDRWTVAITDCRGVICHAEQRFRELVSLEWPQAAKGDDQLPTDLMDKLAANEELAGRRVVLRGNNEKGLMFLRARKRERVDDLTAREFLVAGLLVSGLTQKQVAARLERSPETVRSQVKAIFEKLKINNVAMLAPLLTLRD